MLTPAKMGITNRRIPSSPAFFRLAGSPFSPFPEELRRNRSFQLRTIAHL